MNDDIQHKKGKVINENLRWKHSFGAAHFNHKVKTNEHNELTFIQRVVNDNLRY